MDTVMTIRAYGADGALLSDLQSTVADLEQKLSVTVDTSQIAELNAAGGGTLSPDSLELLESALSLCARTEGNLDISIYPVSRCWGFTREEKQIPDRETLTALLAHVDYRQIRISGDHVTLPQGMMIDLGSVAKGYTGDVLIRRLRQEGISSACLNLGGNVQTIGTKPDGTPWQIGIQDPQSQETLGVLSLSGQAAITSGMYQRYFMGEDGHTYGHILDPATGYPAENDLLSVTVVGQEGVVCDGLSTGLFVMGLEKATQFYRDSSDFDAVFVLRDGSIRITEGIQSLFSLSQSGRKVTVIKR